MLIECTDLSVTLNNHPLLSNISFNVAEGDYMCIVGPNGSGKSTLLKTLNAIVPVTNGKLQLQQRAIGKFSQRKIATLLAYVPQNSGRNLPFMVEDFVRMGRYAHQPPFADWRQQDQDAVESAIRITDCATFRFRQMATLSGGECQRVMIAAALAQDTPMLLLDEPTSFLDPHHQVEVHRLIRKLNQQHHKTILEVTHDINHAGQHAQRVLALLQGKLMWQGPADTFLQAERLRQLYDQSFLFTAHPQTGRNIALVDES